MSRPASHPLPFAAPATARPVEAAADDSVEPIEWLSVVMPAADEALNIPPLLGRLRVALEGVARELEVIVVVPSESDPTHAAAEAAGARVVVQTGLGYGGALVEGLRAARGDYVVTMDADGSHPPEQVPRLLARRGDAEVVVGSRWVDSGSAEMSHSRRIMSRFLNLLFQRLLAVPVNDTSSGFRLYERRVLAGLELVGEKYDILQEILVRLYARGFRVVEIPFDYLPRLSGETHAQPMAFAPHYLGSLWRLFKLRNHHESADYDSRAFDSLNLPQRFWQRRRHAIITRLAVREGARLDVGCGSSRITQDDPAAIGLDRDAAKLRFLRRSNRLLVRADARALPFADGCFDALVDSLVVEYLPRDPGVFRELNRVLAPGAILVIGTPDCARLRWRVAEPLYRGLMPNAYVGPVTRYTRRELGEALIGAGFAIERVRYVFGAELIMRCVKREEAVTAGAPAVR